MLRANATDEDWDLLKSFFPTNWRDLARSSGALKELRQDKSEENYLRILLMHLGCGFSMRETVVRAQHADLAQLSDVAFLKRLRKSKDWLFELCGALFAEREMRPEVSATRTMRLRLLDATTIKEPGPTGSLWRVHYSFQWPTMICDYFKVTGSEGRGTGESLQQFPINPGDFVMVDRGYCHANGIHFVAEQKAWVTVRLNPHGIILQNTNGSAFDLQSKLKPIQKTGQIAVWPVWIPGAGPTRLTARLCVVRKTQAAIALAVKKLKRNASKHGSELQPETLIYAEYVMVLTTFPETEFPAPVILEWYRFRWQIELIFKRFKQIAELGHLPKHDDESAKAWIYGKLFVALLTEKLIQRASAFSPWGYRLETQHALAQSLA